MTKPSDAQLDREINQFLGSGKGSTGARTADGKLPLYGHTSEATAYVVDDYPYGFTARTKIRYWLEHKAKKGWRFVSQTLNPKTNKWNKPKASTYTDFGAAMYLNNKGHVEWTGVGEYTDGKKMLAFVKDFPGADMKIIRQFVPAKIRFLNDMISGKRYMTMNGVRVERSEAENARDRQEIETWEEVNVWLDQAKH